MIRMPAAVAFLAFALLVGTADAGPVEDLDGARTRATERSWLGFVEGKRQRIAKWTAQPRDRAGWQAGLAWQYVDVASGRALEWRPDTPEPATAAADLHAAWVRHVRSYNIHIAHEAALLCRVADDAPACRWALAQLDFYAEHYRGMPLQNRGGWSRLMGQALEESTMLVALADSARLLQPLADELQRERWREGLLRPMTQTIALHDFGVMNIGVWNAAATSIAGLHLGEPALLERGLTGPRGLRALLARGINADGLWHEGSFGYANYVVAAVGKLLHAADVRGRGDLVEPERAAIRRLLQAQVELALDDGTLPAFGDVVGRPRAVDAAVAQELFRHLPLPPLLAAVGTRQTWETLFVPLATVTPVRTAPTAASALDAPSRHWPASRLAVLRAGDWHATLRYGTLPQPKFNAEALHFDLRLGRGAVSTDLGSVEPGLPLHQGYFRLAPAHNVVLIDGEGPSHARDLHDHPGEVEFFNADRAQLAVRHANYRPGVPVWRRYLLDEQGLTVDTRIGRTDGPVRRLGVLLHLDCDAGFALNGATGTALPALAAPAPAGTALQHWSAVQRIEVSAPPQAEWQADLHCGLHPLRLRVNAGTAHRVYQALGPTPESGRLRPLLYVETDAAEATFSLRLERR